MGQEGEPHALPTPPTLLTFTQATRLSGPHRPVGGQVIIHELHFLIWQIQWLPRAALGWGVACLAADARQRLALQQGGRRQVVALLFFDASKLCRVHVMSEAAFGRMLSVLHDSWTYVHVLSELRAGVCILLRRFACVGR